MEFDLQRFGPAPDISGNTTKDGSRVEAFLNPSYPDEEYNDISIVISDTPGLYCPFRFMLYKTQHKWGGGHI